MKTKLYFVLTTIVLLLEVVFTPLVAQEKVLTPAQTNSEKWAVCAILSSDFFKSCPDFYDHDRAALKALELNRANRSPFVFFTALPERIARGSQEAFLKEIASKKQ